jgi:hypothetical protein
MRHLFFIVVCLLTLWVRSFKEPAEPIKIIVPKEASVCVAIREATNEVKEVLQAQYPKCKE